MIIKLPPGRLVQGHPGERITTHTYDDPKKGTPLTNSLGQPRSEFFFAVAVAKTEPEWPAVYAQIVKVAEDAWPQGQSKLPGFYWKIKDGDDPKNAKKEGFAGHWIVSCKSGIAPKVFTRDNTRGYEEVVDPLSVLKCGDYIWAAVNCAGNGLATGPGIYMNGHQVVILGKGEAITGGPTAQEIFGDVLPAASAPPPAQTPVAAPNAAPPVAPPVAPAMDFLSPGIAGATPVMTPSAVAQNLNWQMLVAMGYTAETARAAGYVV